MIDNYYNDNMEANKGIASQIADMYMKQTNRVEEYLVEFFPEEVYHSYYRTFTAEDLNIIRECKKEAIAEDIPFNEILEMDYGHLNEKALEYVDWEGFLDNDVYVYDIDTDNPLKFCTFEVIQVDDSDNVERENIRVPIDDTEYKELLITLLIKSNKYSMNMLVCEKPELAKKISGCAIAQTGYLGRINYNNFAIEMTELKRVVNNILDPSIDKLGIFNSDNESIKQFAEYHKILHESK